MQVQTVTGKPITVPVAFRLSLEQYQALVSLAQKEAKGNLSEVARQFVLRGMEEHKEGQKDDGDAQ